MKGPAKAKTASKPRRTATKKPKAAAPKKRTKGVLLAGGNPQIAKADGDAPVQAYIAAMPGWKSDLGKGIDALIVRNVPNVHKAFEWQGAWSGVPGPSGFLAVGSFKAHFKAGRSRPPKR